MADEKCYIIELVMGHFLRDPLTRDFDLQSPAVLKPMWVGEGGHPMGDKKFAQRYTKVGAAKGSITKCLVNSHWYCDNEVEARDAILAMAPGKGMWASGQWLQEINILEVVDVVTTSHLKIR